MDKMKPLSGKELIKVLQKRGFQITRQRGSHVRLVHSDGRKTSVPVHANETIGPWLLNKIVKRELKLSMEEFRKWVE